MTEEPARAEPPPIRATVLPADFARKRDYLPLLYLLGFLVLAGSLVFLWQNPPVSEQTRQASQDLDGVKQQLATLSARPAGPTQADFARLQQQVAALQARPEVAPAALGQLTDRVTALANRPAADPAALQQLGDRVAALEGRKAVTPEQLALLSDQVQAVGRQIPDLKPLDAKVAALEARPAYDPAASTRRFDELGSKLQQAQDADGKLAARVDGLDKQASAQGDQLKALTQRAQITARLQGMAAALAAGQKLGDIPGAPPALARFATTAPPTEAALRESFPRYADAASKVSQPAAASSDNFGARLWGRAQQAVTVRQGDRVLVGDPIAGVLAGAHDKLDNGDLAGAVEALRGLPAPAAAAMQPWTDQAQSLVAARAAIANLAAN